MLEEEEGERVGPGWERRGRQTVALTGDSAAFIRLRSDRMSDPGVRQLPGASRTPFPDI